jgi:choloylglycine hydrolase
MKENQTCFKPILLSVICALTFIIQPVAHACTGIMLRNADDTFVHGRTGEFGYFLDVDVIVVPRQYEFTGETPEGDGLKFKTKYASVGAIAFDVLGYLDGINEKGLAAGAFFFPSYAGYPEISDTNQHKALSPSQLPNWILGQFSNVAEVRAAIERGEVVIAPTLVKGFGTEPPPFKYVVYDKTGESIVIEPLNGKLVIYNNPLGSMSNSPTHDWHLTNLRNYIALDPRNVPPVEIAGEKLSQLGQGSGMLGLPGDFSPPSRFVRASVFSATAVPSENASDGVKQVFHILNNFDIPVGVAREEHEGGVQTDYTIITVARDPQSLHYYWNTYEDQTLRMVDLNKFDLNAKEVLKLKTNTDQPIVDMSDQLE